MDILMLGAVILTKMGKSNVEMHRMKKAVLIFRRIVITLIANFAAVRIRYGWLIVLSVLLHRLPFAVFEPESFVELKRVFQILSYLVLLWALSYNLHLWSIRIMVLGTLLNFAAIVANGGLMPVSPEARRLANMTPLGQSQIGMVLPEGSGVLLPIDQTNLWVLTDVLPAAHLGGVFSPGDILIGMSLLIFLLEATCVKKNVVPRVSPDSCHRCCDTPENPQIGDDRTLS